MPPLIVSALSHLSPLHTHLPLTSFRLISPPEYVTNISLSTCPKLSSPAFALSPAPLPVSFGWLSRLSSWVSQSWVCSCSQAFELPCISPVFLWPDHLLPFLFKCDHPKKAPKFAISLAFSSLCNTILIRRHVPQGQTAFVCLFWHMVFISGLNEWILST